MLIDQFNRVHTYLRISLTDSCNMRCNYCMPLLSYKGMDTEKLMNNEEIVAIAEIFVAQGINKIRLTGGEPLLRKGFKDIVEKLSKLPVQLAISTNGLLIDKHIDTLKKYGVTEVNVSLDSLDAVSFKEITRNGKFAKIMQNIEALLLQDFKVKINTVLVQSLKKADILKLVEWTKNTLLEVRFIEFMPFANNNWDASEVVNYIEVVDFIKSNYSIQKLEDVVHSTSKMYQVNAYKGKFGFISTVSNPFCESCNRLRLTADGKMKNCLFGADEIDILNAYRKGENILPLLQQSVSSKHQSLGGLNHLKEKDTRSMIGIGG